MLKLLTNFMVAGLIAFWLGAIAIFSIQNITAVSLTFLLWQSIKLPIGVLLAFCVSGGFILGALLPILWQPLKPKGKRRLSRETQSSNDFDFDFDQ
ncbi:LapA family protein [Crocosphaera sp. UHCC 0190]|uniref:LapA family protein n=1 Tax=Crocosphaera sp. UHCC 0190 TaxID=3110246 RepID=UPI002B208CDD|nr:LapA family protein [Crocosphaera sp. UHCC 0190]MEA5509991.1 LapA family protein [Crocosphaera sp. UHCC 0190]